MPERNQTDTRTYAPRTSTSEATAFLRDYIDPNKSGQLSVREYGARRGYSETHAASWASHKKGAAYQGLTVDERQQLGKRLQENQHQRLWQPDVNTAAAQAPAPDPTMVKKSTDITERSGILREYLTSPIVSVHVFLEKKPDANVTRRAFGDWVKNRSHDLTEQEENTLLGKLERDSFLQSKTVFKIKEKRADQSTEDSRGGFMRGGPAASGSVQANLYPPDPQGQPGVLGTEAVATFAAAPAQSPYARNPNDPNTLASTSADAQDTLRPIGSAYAYNPSSGPLPSISAYAQNTLPPIGSAYAYNPSSGPLPSISRQSAAQAQQPPGTAQGGPRR